MGVSKRITRKSVVDIDKTWGSFHEELLILTSISEKHPHYPGHLIAAQAMAEQLRTKTREWEALLKQEEERWKAAHPESEVSA